MPSGAASQRPDALSRRTALRSLGGAQLLAIESVPCSAGTDSGDLFVEGLWSRGFRKGREPKLPLFEVDRHSGA